MDIKHLELFSGIGGFRQAFRLLERDFAVPFSSVGFSEIDKSAAISYNANFDTSKEIEMGDIVSFVQNKKNIESIPNFDLLTGGFPCQSFSMMGKQNGFGDMRGNVFFQIIDIMKVKKPQYILLENVRNIITHNKGETFKTVLSSIEEAGYPYVYYDVFNSADFGLAQKRNRVYVFASKTKMDNFEFNKEIVKRHFDAIKNTTSLLQHENTLEILEKEVDSKYYLSEIIKPTILSNGTKKFVSKSEINQLIAKPLTATMVKMHRACQDNYYSYEFINSDNPVEYTNIHFSKEELAKHKIRKITPKEAFLLQGFNEEFFAKAESVGTSNAQLYKQAGNAVSVNTVYAITHYLLTALGILGR